MAEIEGRFSDLPPAPAVAATPASARQVYTLRIRAEPGTDEIHALRALLKAMLRRFGFRCLSIVPEKMPPPAQG